MGQDGVRHLHNGPCPNCGSRDNMGTWSDGHTYCFGCQKSTPGAATIKSLKLKIKERMGGYVDDPKVPVDISRYTYVLPKECKLWLRKYGVSDSMILGAKIMWNPDDKRLVFPVYIDDKLRLTSERYFGDDHNAHKYLTHGPKSLVGIVMQPTFTHHPNTVVVVEDYVSALRISRQYYATPLFGVDFPALKAVELAKMFSNVRVWLDRDKATKSIQEASRASQYGLNARSIITENDPKEYSDEAIDFFIRATL